MPERRIAPVARPHQRTGAATALEKTEIAIEGAWRQNAAQRVRLGIDDAMTSLANGALWRRQTTGIKSGLLNL